MSKKVVLGFSGGLDTTYCVKYFTEEKGYEVHSVIVNTGGFSEEELEKIAAHAYKLGVKTHTAIDAVNDRTPVCDIKTCLYLVAIARGPR